MSKVIVLTGPESTGKSSLCKALATHYRCKSFPEYARVYLEERGTTKYSYADVEQVAKGQIKQYKEAVSEPEPYAFLDTFLIITKIWFQWVYAKEPAWLAHEMQQHNVHLYLLCKPDLPWESDPLRENGGAKRLRLYDVYKSELEKRNYNYIEIEGSGEERLQNAIAAIDSLEAK